MTNQFYSLEKREDGQLVSITVGPKKPLETIEIGSQTTQDIADAKSALSAASDFFKFGKITHPETKVGLHVYAGTNLKSFRVANAALISTAYAGKDFPVPSEAEFPQHWAQVNILNGRKTLVHLADFDGDKGERRARKSDFWDALLMGIAIKIRVLPFNFRKNEDGLGYADYFVQMWDEPDMDKALKMRADHFAHYQMAKKINAPVKAAIKAGEVNHTKTTEEAIEAYGSVLLTTVSGEIIDMLSIEEGSLIRVYDTRRSVDSVIKWDGTDYAMKRLVAISKMRNWTIKVEK